MEKKIYGVVVKKIPMWGAIVHMVIVGLAPSFFMFRPSHPATNVANEQLISPPLLSFPFLSLSCHENDSDQSTRSRDQKMTTYLMCRCFWNNQSTRSFPLYLTTAMAHKARS